MIQAERLLFLDFDLVSHMREWLKYFEDSDGLRLVLLEVGHIRHHLIQELVQKLFLSKFGAWL